MIKLETERLILRDYKETDLTKMHRLWSDKDTMYYLDDILCHSVEDSAKYLKIGMANADGHYFCITEKPSDDFIGSIGYTMILFNLQSKQTQYIQGFSEHKHI